MGAIIQKNLFSMLTFPAGCKYNPSASALAVGVPGRNCDTGFPSARRRMQVQPAGTEAK